MKALLLILAIASVTSAGAASPVVLPVNSPQLSLARPYAVFTGSDQPRPLDLNAPDSQPPPGAGDFYAYWSVPATVQKGIIAAKRRTWTLRGKIIAAGALDELIAAGAEADHPGIGLKPRLTRDAAENRYRLGFDLRLVADLTQRIPLPTLDLSDFAGGADWIRYWIDECVRNGVAGLRVIPPGDAAGAQSVHEALTPLMGPNVYLPPPSEVAILLPERSAESSAAFQCYAGLRASGVWTNFVSQEQILSRTVSLARYSVVVCPLPLAPATKRAVEDSARRGAIVVVVGDVEQRGARVLASAHDGRPLITERHIGDGRWIAAKSTPWSSDGAWTPFWDGILSDARVPRRRWIEAVSARNVGRITGRYSRPAPAK